MITVDGEAVNPGDGDSDEDAVAKAVRAARIELKLCKALAALNPPPDLSGYLHAHIVELRGHGGTTTPPTTTSCTPPTSATPS